LIGSGRLVVMFGMLSERDPEQLISALRRLDPDAAVFTEAASAHGHVIAPERLAEIYGPGADVARPAAAALERALALAGTDGTVFACGSLYLVGEVLALTGSSGEIEGTGRPSPRSSAGEGRAPARRAARRR
jgi:folylpolyglutamate synthase/dihydropteroate synthase